MAAHSEPALGPCAVDVFAAAPGVKRPERLVARVLIVSPDAGGMSDAIQRTLDSGLPNYEQIAFNTRRDFRRGLSSQATVVVAGGDGTIAFVARALAGSRRRLGILPLGTYNNFARGLGIPTNLRRALAVIRAGRTRSVTLGRVNDHYFLEAAAIGIFGEAILLGEKAKDGALTSISRELGAVVKAQPFAFTTRGDFEGHGRSRSLVFTNTPSTGSRLPIGTTEPTDPYLELSVGVGASRSDLLGRLVASSIRDKHEDDDTISFRFRALTITTKPRMAVVADNQRAGRTPATVQAVPGALRVIVPA
jgi:YegS/Rv2252/BmrU family lipid kinase